MDEIGEGGVECRLGQQQGVQLGDVVAAVVAQQGEDPLTGLLC